MVDIKDPAVSLHEKNSEVGGQLRYFQTEDEPSTYNIRWKTLMAILALSVSNVCVAIANTVSSLSIQRAEDRADRLNRQIP